jgi:hypothetical protein
MAGSGDAAIEWPDDTDESAFLSELAARGEAVAPVPVRNVTQVTGDKLPPLEEMIAKVPPDVAALLDDLFRAKFTGVRKYADAGAAIAGPK